MPKARTRVRLTPALLIVAAAFFVVFAAADGFGAGAFAESAATCAIYLAGVALHESAHARAARRFGLRVEGITLSLAGGMTRYSGPDPGPRPIRAIALAGPKRSALLGVACLAVASAAWIADWRGSFGPLAIWAAQVNLALALVNLLPFGTLDGALARKARR
jgi:Zn-dependent protease